MTDNYIRPKKTYTDQLDEDDIEEQLEFLKSTNKIYSKAATIKPKLEEQEIMRIEQMEDLQRQRTAQLQANRQKYQHNMSTAIDTTFSDKTLSNTIKHSIFEPVYESAFRPGMKVTAFQRGLEDLQLDPQKNQHHLGSLQQRSQHWFQ